MIIVIKAKIIPDIWPAKAGTIFIMLLFHKLILVRMIVLKSLGLFNKCHL